MSSGRSTRSPRRRRSGSPAACWRWIPALTTYVANDPRKDFVGARDAGLRTIRVGHVPDEGGCQTWRTFDPSADADRTVERFADLSAALRR